MMQCARGGDAGVDAEAAAHPNQASRLLRVGHVFVSMGIFLSAIHVLRPSLRQPQLSCEHGFRRGRHGVQHERELRGDTRAGSWWFNIFDVSND